jgi:hypothetical protein
VKNTKKKLSDAIKGMQIKNWEARENSEGKRVVYVRFIPKSPEITVVVNLIKIGFSALGDFNREH